MRRKLITLALVALVFAGLVGYSAYSWIYQSNTSGPDPVEILVPTGSDYDHVLRLLADRKVIENPTSFDAVAKLMKYPSLVKPGRYLISPGWSNKRLVSKLRSGQQDPVKVTISTARLMGDVAAAISTHLEADSAEVYHSLTSPKQLQSLQLNSETAIAQVIPNTYEFYWNTSGEQCAERIRKEYNQFWSKKGRSQKAERLQMTRAEVSTLASIVESETNHLPERPTMAGVYLNRIEQGIPLAADPTVVFGLGDFGIRRVLYRHINTDTPYNTYMHAGLPPGPIRMPSISSIDAVLNREPHDYLFFCAKPGYNNGHVFAETNAEHERNARRYHRWLDQEGIKG
ncbi:MAG: endolytic transglycosylase MltG [Bacteroidota bacterium]